MPLFCSIAGFGDWLHPGVSRLLEGTAGNRDCIGEER
jgi:hypothetical protein